MWSLGDSVMAKGIMLVAQASVSFLLDILRLFQCRQVRNIKIQCTNKINSCICLYLLKFTHFECVYIYYTVFKIIDKRCGLLKPFTVIISCQIQDTRCFQLFRFNSLFFFQGYHIFSMFACCVVILFVPDKQIMINKLHNK